MDGAPAGRIRRPKEATRSIILEKAYEMYVDQRLTPGDERLASVLHELGYTTGAGYQIWDNQAAFRCELATYVAENIDYVSLRAMAGEIAELRSLNLPFEERVLAAGDRFMSGFSGREEFYMKLRFVSMRNDRPSQVTAALRSAYEVSSAEAAEVFSGALEEYGRRVREPFAMSDLTSSVTAALEGFALRDRIQPQVVSKELELLGGKHHVFSAVLLAIMNQFTEPIPQ